jgi:hypothetical protein
MKILKFLGTELSYAQNKNRSKNENLIAHLGVIALFSSNLK